MSQILRVLSDMSSIKNNPNMTANVAATKIQCAWRSGRAKLLRKLPLRKLPLKDLVCEVTLAAPPMPPPDALTFQPSRYGHADNKFCSTASPSPTCELCFRYFCSYCKQGVGGMYSVCRATDACRERAKMKDDAWRMKLLSF